MVALTTTETLQCNYSAQYGPYTLSGQSQSDANRIRSGKLP